MELILSVRGGERKWLERLARRAMRTPRDQAAWLLLEAIRAAAQQPDRQNKALIVAEAAPRESVSV